jgi:hypothetical protein
LTQAEVLLQVVQLRRLLLADLQSDWQFGHQLLPGRAAFGCYPATAVLQTLQAPCQFARRLLLAVQR